MAVAAIVPAEFYFVGQGDNRKRRCSISSLRQFRTAFSQAPESRRMGTNAFGRPIGRESCSCDREVDN